ncbi:MAG: MTH938/NDUFAF3 family protein [Acidimicrobiia bacterium]|jgi:hypothetical protein
MDIEYPAFGTIIVNGEKYEHDVILENGRVRARDKGPSRSLKSSHGHTPLSAREDIPWSTSKLVIGSGYSGRLPVLPEIEEEAQKRNIELTVMPTASAVETLNAAEEGSVNAVLHVTC